MWYKIEEQLPDLNVPVLITDGEVIVVAIRTAKDYRKWGWDASGFSGYEWDWDFDERFITHWTQLPSLPT